MTTVNRKIVSFGIDPDTGQRTQVANDDSITGGARALATNTDVFEVDTITDGEFLKRNGNDLDTATAGTYTILTSGSTSVANETNTLLHTWTPVDGITYFAYFNIDESTAPNILLKIGYYGVYTGIDTGYGQINIENLTDGDLELRIVFDQGGMSSNLLINWQIIEIPE